MLDELLKEKIKFEKNKKSGLRKCPGYWPIYLRHSRAKKALNKEDNLILDCYDKNGQCLKCGGYKMPS